MRQYIYGKNTVLEALKGNKPVYQVYMMKNVKDDKIIALAQRKNIQVNMITQKSVLNDMVGGKVVHQGIVAQVEGYDYYTIDEIVSSIPKGKQPLLLMLDGLEDPHNLGAILRTCDAIEVDGVIIGKNRSVGLTPTVAKVSTGAIDHVKVAQVTNLSRTLEDLKKQGYWVVGCDLDNSQDYRAIDYNMPLVIVIGSEGFGISRLVKSHCDMNVILPMTGHVTSLNASVATAVILYQVLILATLSKQKGGQVDEYNEEELLYLIRCGSEEAIDLLLEKYFYRISSWIMPYCHYEYLGFDKDDLIQIGMIHFKTILDTYRLDLNNNLYSYAKKSVIRKIVKTIEYIKEDVLYRNNFFISFDDYAYDREEGYYYKDIIPDEKETYRPENRFMIKERAIGYKKTFQSQTSSQEKEIMTYLRKGYNAKEIAKIMDISLKSVYNAIYRCRRKCKPLTKKNKCVKL